MDSRRSHRSTANPTARRTREFPSLARFSAPRTRRVGIALGVGLAGLVLASACANSAPKAVFLIVVDTLRADRLSCYGYAGHRTPHIDALAEAGVRFERAQSAASWTVPSMGSLFTSLYPTQLGLIEAPSEATGPLGWRVRREQLSQSLPLQRTTLAEILQSAGFRTAAFVNQPGLNVGEGFQQGFDDWFFPAGPADIRRYDRSKPLVARQWGPYLKLANVVDRAVIRSFGSWLGEHRGEPLLAWLHLLTPHTPYTPGHRYTEGRSNLTPAEQYAAEVREADDLVGEILVIIDHQVGLENALIVLTSDHGEALGEHRMHEHGHSLHREVTEVPLIVAAPGLPAGTSVPAPVQTLDILPTVLDITGVPLAGEVEGSSLLSHIAGNGAERPVYSEGMLYGSSERSLTREGYKLMLDVGDDREQLFDVITDPLERVDLARRQPARARALRDELTALHARLLADYVPAEEPEDEREALRALKALGYVED